jgi:hypothetical protein
MEAAAAVDVVVVVGLRPALLFQGDKGQLSDIDQFLMKLMLVPELKSRLDLLLTIHEVRL